MITIKQITAKETYPLRHSVMWPNQPISFIQLPDDEKGIHFGLFRDKELLSVISLFIDQKSAQFRKFATISTEQNKGYGTFLLKHVIDFTINKNLILLWCNARVYKTAYYKKFGFKETNKTYRKKEIDFVIIEKEL
jgi:predicted GNAT family N-acyltransferase